MDSDAMLTNEPPCSKRNLVLTKARMDLTSSDDETLSTTNNVNVQNTAYNNQSSNIEIPSSKTTVPDELKRMDDNYLSNTDEQSPDVPQSHEMATMDENYSCAEAVVQQQSTNANDKISNTEHLSIIQHASFHKAAEKFYDAMEETMNGTIICVCCGDVALDVILLRCGHIYCQICMEKWLTTRCTHCPSCRADLYLENVECIPEQSLKYMETLHEDLEILRTRFLQVSTQSKERREKLRFQEINTGNDRQCDFYTRVPINRKEFVLAAMNHQALNKTNIYDMLFPAAPTEAREQYKKLYKGWKFGVPINKLIWKDICLSVGSFMMTYNFVSLLQDDHKKSLDKQYPYWGTWIYGILYICTVNFCATLLHNI